MCELTHDKSCALCSKANCSVPPPHIHTHSHWFNIQITLTWLWSNNEKLADSFKPWSIMMNTCSEWNSVLRCGHCLSLSWHKHRHWCVLMCHSEGPALRLRTIVKEMKTSGCLIVTLWNTTLQRWCDAQQMSRNKDFKVYFPNVLGSSAEQEDLLQIIITIIIIMIIFMIAAPDLHPVVAVMGHTGSSGKDLITLCY